MSDLVLIPFPGLGTLALSRDPFDSALVAGRGLPSRQPTERLLSGPKTRNGSASR
jgi:hypothetical protein